MMTNALKPRDQQVENQQQSANAVRVVIVAIESWGWFPLLSLIEALGVFLMALAYEAGRSAAWWTDLLFWFSLLIIFVPVVWRLLFQKIAEREVIALLTLLGSALYFVKFLAYPLYFAYYDEFSHWRTLDDIIASGHLFHQNLHLLISPFYPGLEIVTDFVMKITGLPLFTAGLLVIGVGRLIFVLALYLFSRRLSGSIQIAALFTVLYMTNPNFMFFDGQFAYESLALPLTLFVFYVTTLRYDLPAGYPKKSLSLVTCLGLAAVVITHHITSFALTLLLLLWAIVSLHRSQRGKDRRALIGIALLSIALTVAWTMYTNDIVIGYLSPHVTSTIAQAVAIITHQTAPRQLFHSDSGFVSPLWERVATYLSVGLIVLGLPLGLFQIWHYYRRRAEALVLATAALLYPGSQALRLTAAGSETGVRATEFLFLGVAFALAVGVVSYGLSPKRRRRWSTVILWAITIIFVGQIIAGEGPTWIRTPGPYLVSGDERSIEPEGITAAQWAFAYLGPGHPMVSDRVNTFLMTAYGNQQVYTDGSIKAQAEPVIISLEFGPSEEAILREDKLQYLVIDHRLSTHLPWVGTYFSGDQSVITQPIALAALTKFDNVKEVSRVFDSGNIVIYDVSAISGERSPPITSSQKSG